MTKTDKHTNIQIYKTIPSNFCQEQFEFTKCCQWEHLPIYSVWMPKGKAVQMLWMKTGDLLIQCST